MVPTVSVITVLAACAFLPRPRPLDDAGLVVMGGGGAGGGVASLFTGDSLTGGGGGDGEGGGGGVGSLGGGDGDGAWGGGDGDGKFSSTSEFEGLLDNGVEFFVLGLTRLEKENKKRLTLKGMQTHGLFVQKAFSKKYEMQACKRNIKKPTEKEV